MKPFDKLPEEEQKDIIDPIRMVDRMYRGIFHKLVSDISKQAMERIGGDDE